MPKEISMQYLSVVVLFAGLVSGGYSGYSYAGPSDVVRLLGFEVTKPPGWHYAPAQDPKSSIVTMTKFAEPYGPSFKVNIAAKTGQLEGKQPAEILRLIIGTLPVNKYNDFELVQPPVEVEVSGIRSAYARTNKTTQVLDGSNFSYTSEWWIVPREDDLFLILAGGCDGGAYQLAR
jgi:hypothetical protein